MLIIFFEPTKRYMGVKISSKVTKVNSLKQVVKMVRVLRISNNVVQYTVLSKTSLFYKIEPTSKVWRHEMNDQYITARTNKAVQGKDRKRQQAYSYGHNLATLRTFALPTPFCKDY